MDLKIENGSLNSISLQITLHSVILINHLLIKHFTKDHKRWFETTPKFVQLPVLTLIWDVLKINRSPDTVFHFKNCLKIMQVCLLFVVGLTLKLLFSVCHVMYNIADNRQK